MLESILFPSQGRLMSQYLLFGVPEVRELRTSVREVGLLLPDLHDSFLLFLERVIVAFGMDGLDLGGETVLIWRPISLIKFLARTHIVAGIYHVIVDLLGPFLAMVFAIKVSLFEAFCSHLLVIQVHCLLYREVKLSIQPGSVILYRLMLVVGVLLAHLVVPGEAWR